MHPNAGLSELWITKYGRLIAGEIRDLVTERATRGGVKGFHLHRLRITFAHRWLRAGGQPGDLMRILGLRSRMMIDGYADGVGVSRSIEAARARFTGGP